ncbi:hypothetical protein POTOM_046630 [Populus tomentosa]|uniref:PIN domain-containing protein n=1 Tax=Populus tomentosa TaxID=118781 RepID=A0A8X7YB77_POPTO|nr:hypothetical protein POTOM_046630 [Populus tomentosa]
MGRAKKGPKFAKMKKMITSKAIKQPQVSSALFFSYNTALGPPYRVLVDTNFINFSIQNKLDLEKAMLDCLYAKCTPCITDCVMAELEKLGQKYRVALRNSDDGCLCLNRIAKDPRFERLPCIHKGTYADDCIVERVTKHKCYIVATCDRDLKRRIRKIPGVPIMYITQHKYSIERLPEATVGGEQRILLDALECYLSYHMEIWLSLNYAPTPLKLGHRSFAVFLNLMGGRNFLYSHANAFIPHELDLGGVTASIVDAEDKDSDDL